MDTMNVSVPENLQAFVVAQVSGGGYRSVNDYVAALIEADQKQKAKAVVEAEVLKGVLSGIAPMTDDDWASLRARAAGPSASD